MKPLNHRPNRVLLALSLGALVAVTRSPDAAAAVTFEEVHEACKVVECGAPPNPQDQVTVARVTSFCRLARGPLPAGALPDVPSETDITLAIRYFDDGHCKRPADAGGASAERTQSKDAASFGFSQSTLLWGLTDFLVGRAREEINEFVVDRFTKRLCAKPKDATTIAFKDLFPESCKLLTDEDLLTEFMSGFTTLQTAFRADIRGLPLALVTQIGTHYPDKAPPSLRLAFTLAEEVLTGKPPLAALRAVSQNTFLANAPCTAMDTRLLFLGGIALSASIAEKGDGTFALPGDATGYRYAAMAFAVTTTTLAANGNELASCIVKSASSYEPTFEAIAGLLTTFSEAAAAGKVLADSGASTEARVASLARLTSKCIDLVVATSEAFPHSALSAATKSYITTAKTLADYLATGNYGRLALGIRDLALVLGAKDVLPRGFVRVVSFAVDYALAKDVDAATSAISAFAAPRGGYKGKRRGDGIYLKLNAYLGAGVAYELVDDNPGIALGGYAPIGLEIGAAIGDGWSLGLLGHVLDLGALTTWRIKNLDEADTTSARPEVGVEQVVSLGAAVVLGIKDSPFAAALSISRVPKLRLDESDTLSPCFKGCEAWRIGATVLIDIPIM